ncbi:hypothetical protein GTZ96_016710 [Flavobacterium sp. BBQ-18]|nr:hypothetical protein [Flavobacterium undicola]
MINFSYKDISIKKNISSFLVQIFCSFSPNTIHPFVSTYINLTASEADKQLTQKAKVAGRLLDITLLDSLIIATESYYSFVYKFKL